MIRFTGNRGSCTLAQAGLALPMLFGVAVWSASASAQTAPNLCFPQPIGVPGLFGQPTWATAPTNSPSAGDVVRTDLNEPRWSASPLTNFANDPGNSSTGEGGIRLILSPDGTELSVSIQNTADPSPSSSDGAYFGLYVSGGNGVAIKVPIFSGTTDPYFYPSGQATTYSFAGGSSWTPNLGALPSWIEAGTLASWTHQAVNAGGADWAVQFKVLLANVGINSSTPFKIFVGMHKADNGITPDVTIPATPNPAPGLIANTIIPADPTTNAWQQAPTLAAGCPGGIAFTSPLQIGTTNSDSSLISTVDGATNTFVANPTVPSTLTVGRNTVQAKFRIANWGAQIADPAAPWTTIVNGSAVLNGASANGVVPFQFSCPTNSGGNVCGAPPPTGSLDDQCMLVQLSNAPFHTTPITTASVYRNMRFGTLSTKTFPADISIKGLQAITGVPMDRDVYIQVIQRNMPPQGNFPLLLNSQLMNLLRSAALGLITAIDPLLDSLSLDAQMKVVWPTYEVHVYYDTGRTNTIDGATYKVLTPMNSFGYYLSHDGTFYGFTTALGGVSKALTPLGTNQFKVRIPNEGTVRIQSGVTAEEIPQFLVPLGNRACEIWPWAC